MNRLMDERVHMPRHRIGARGNITCFPLPWEELSKRFSGSTPRADRRRGSQVAAGGGRQSMAMKNLADGRAPTAFSRGGPANAAGQVRATWTGKGRY